MQHTVLALARHLLRPGAPAPRPDTRLLRIHTPVDPAGELNQGELMKKAAFGLVAGLAMLGAAGNLEAQVSPLSLEVRGGAPFPTGSFEDAYNTGVSYEITGIVNVAPGLGVYAGYGQTDFELRDAAIDGNATDRGVHAGLRASVPGNLPFGPWVRGGVVYNELHRGALGVRTTSERELGYEIGGGLEFPLGRHVSVTPGATFVSTDRDTVTGGDDNINYVRADIGLRVRL